MKLVAVALRWRGVRRAPLRLVAGGTLVGVAAFLAAVAFVAWPLPPELLAQRPASSLRVLDRTGEPLREVLAPREGRSVPLSLAGVSPETGSVVPPLVRAAFVSAEDRRFDEHQGVDPRAVLRALKDSLRARRIVSGASTIPQQLARLLVPRERTVVGKIKEALWALRLSAHLDKEQILVEYLNRVPLGNGTVGVEAASRFVFGRPARMLSPAQAALLAGLAHAPAHEDPFRHPERALRRRAVVLERMRAAGFIDEDVLARALAEPLDPAGGRERTRAPHFTLDVIAGLAAHGLAEAVEVETSIDPRLQEAVERIMDEELTGPLERARVGQAAVVVLDNTSGEILAYTGSRDFFDVERQGMNDGARARRQPGSALKPFVYGLAMARGMTPATVLPDVELTLATESGTYAPRNYDKRVHGPVRLRTALQNSYNIPAVHVAEVLTPERVVGALRAAGFTTLDESPQHYGVGVVLGNGDVTLVELARAYRGLARGGVVEPLVSVRAARDGGGRALPIAADLEPRRFLPANVVALLTDILVDEPSRALAFGFDNALSLPFPVAAKTGTSRAYVDNWTAGFTRERTVAVWAGNFDGTPMKHVSGITGAGVIFRRVMLAAMKDVLARGAPAPLVDRSAFETARICPFSGLLAGPSCAGAFDEHFLPGTAPRHACDTHHMVAQTPQDCPSSSTRAIELPPRYAGWARAEGLSLVDGRVRCGGGAARYGRARPRLLSPVDGDEFALELGIPAGQGVPLKVRADGHDVLVVRSDDGEELTLRPPFHAWLSGRRGTRRVAVFVPGAGAPVDEAEFIVR